MRRRPSLAEHTTRRAGNDLSAAVAEALSGRSVGRDETDSPDGPAGQDTVAVVLTRMLERCRRRVQRLAQSVRERAGSRWCVCVCVCAARRTLFLVLVMNETHFIHSHEWRGETEQD